MSTVEQIRIEHRVMPIGLDETSPSISWELHSDEKELTQTAYRLQIQAEEGELVYDSQEQQSDEQLVVVSTLALSPFTKYLVMVEVQLSNGERVSGESFFETGILDATQFKGQWICAPKEVKVPVFLKTLQLSKAVRFARLAVVARGVYDVELDGVKVGDDILAPGWTSYTHRIPYQVYPLDLQENVGHELAITVAPGWYAGLLGFVDERNHFGDHLSVLAQVVVQYEDGTTDCFATDESWGYTVRSVQESELYLGEIVDFTHKSQTHPVQLATPYEGTIVSQEQEPVKITETFEPVQRFVTPKGESVIDFGQNIAGFVEVELDIPAGEKLVVNHAETLDKDGDFYPDTLRTAVSIDSFVSDGQKRVVQPRFTFHGFRYIRLEGTFDLETIRVKACAIRSAFESNSTFETSNELVNRLFKNIQWSHWDNFVDIPTDCPQRNERLGWTGDAQIFAKTATLLSRTFTFYSKWLKDLAVEQTDEFGVPQVVPNILGDMPGIAAWSDAATIIPWTLYQQYGDKRILERQLDSMKQWVDYVTRQTNEVGLWQQGFQYGDWLGLDKEEGPGRTGATDVYFVANSYYLYSIKILVQALEVLGDDRASEYQRLYDATLQAFQEEYFTKTGRLVTETQTACVLALYFDLAPEFARDRLREILVTNIMNHKKHLTTGFVGTPYLNLLLSEVSEHELAGDLFLQEDYPSWLYAVKMGATTIWERWNSIKPDGSFDESGMNSLNHYAYGSIAQWLFEKVAGIEAVTPGYKTFSVKPRLISGLHEVKVAQAVPYGVIRSEWTCRNGVIKGLVEVPVNTKATIVTPDNGEVFEVGSGVYTFEYATELNLDRNAFSQDSTVGSLLENPKAIEFLQQFAPETLDSPMFKLAVGMTVGEISAYSPETKQLFDGLLAYINQ